MPNAQNENNEISQAKNRLGWLTHRLQRSYIEIIVPLQQMEISTTLFYEISIDGELTCSAATKEWCIAQNINFMRK